MIRLTKYILLFLLSGSLSFAQTRIGVGQYFITFRAASGSLIAAETTTALSGLGRFRQATVLLDITTLTLADADDEVDFYIQTTYDDGTTWCDLKSFHFSNTEGDDGTTARVKDLVSNALDGPGAELSLAGTNPAAGQPLSETVPANTIWRLLSFTASLLTDGTATPTIGVTLDDGTTVFYQELTQSAQPISVTETYLIAPLGFTRAVADGNNVIPIPLDTVLAAGYRIITTGHDGGDDWAAPQFLVEAWADPNVCTDGTMGDHLKAYSPLGSQIRIKTAVTGATAPTYAYSATALFR